MKPAVVIALSRQDENALRLIAQGVDQRKYLRIGDIDLLKELSLVEEVAGRLALTQLGRLRLAQAQEKKFLAVAVAACGLGREVTLSDRTSS